MIAAAGLTRRFGSRAVVEDLTFEVNHGEIVALLGPNGAGKTTTLRMLAGLISPSSGWSSIDGVRLTRATGSLLRTRIGFLTEAPGLWDRLTVRENLQIYARLYRLAGARTIESLFEQLGLSSHANARAAELSKGMRQKAALARALLHNPSILLLDEPTAGLDPEVTRTVRLMLLERRAAGCATLISTHNLDEAERIADRVAVLQQRLLALDTAESLRQRLMTGRVIIRLGEPGSVRLDLARTFDPAAVADGNLLVLTLESERAVPDLVRALSKAGASIFEIRRETPPLEEVYLRLVREPGRDAPS